MVQPVKIICLSLSVGDWDNSRPIKLAEHTHMEEVWKYLSVFLLSGLKFIFGPTIGNSYGFPAPVTAILTACGMMLPVYLFTFFGEKMRMLMERFRKKERKKFTKKNRRFVKVWNKYGVKGVAILTPLIFTPIGGAILANVFGGHKNDIIKWMWIAALFWAFVLSFVVKYAYWIIREWAVV
jgi:hypothetical protein